MCHMYLYRSLLNDASVFCMHADLAFRGFKDFVAYVQYFRLMYKMAISMLHLESKVEKCIWYVYENISYVFSAIQRDYPYPKRACAHV